MTAVRTAILGLVMVMAAAGPADARRGGIVVINLGDDVMHLRQTSSEAVTSEDGSEAHLDQIGYHYQRLGLFWVDLWRWDGEYILYSKDGQLYIPLTDAELAALGGAPFPIGYHLPPGLLLLLAGGYFLIVRRKPRTVKFTLIAGGVLLAITAILFLLGLGPACMIPGFLGLYHLAAAKWSPASNDDEVIEDHDGASDPASSTPRPAPRPSAPRVETDPYRAPPQAAPIHVERPSTPVVAPLAVDPDAEAPKLLT